MFAVCLLTAPSLKCSRDAIAALEQPSAISESTSRSRGVSVAMIAFLPTMFFGGVYLPRPLLPEVFRRIGDYVPPGTQPLQDAWVGTGVQPLQLVVLGAFAVIGTALAAKLFRWE